MTDLEVRKHNMSYLGLNNKQYDYYEKLMAKKTNEWSQELIQYVRSRPGAFSGDALACAVADWVKSRVQ